MAITAPSDLSVKAVSSSKCNVSWSNPDTYNGIEVNRSLNGSSWSVVARLSGTDTGYSDDSCQDGTRYYYRVEVSNEAAESDYSNSDSDITTLPAPSGASGSATDDTATVTWEDNSQNESGFKVYMDGTLVATKGVNVTSHTETGLTQGSIHSFYVVAYNAVITSSKSNTVTLECDDPPNKPTLLYGVPTGTTTAALTWQDNADNETSFSLERSSTSASAGFSEVATPGANVETYADSSLTSNTQYWYRIRAHNSSGYSAYSDVATLTTFAAIAAPQNLVCEAVSDTEIDIYFDDNSELEDYHCVERKQGVLGAYSEIVQLPPNQNCYRDTGLTTGTQYFYKVRAKQGASSYSSYCDEDNVFTWQTPGAPSDFAVSEYQDTWLRLTWTDPLVTNQGDDVRGYEIAQSLNDSDYTTVATIDYGLHGKVITDCKISGLTAGTTYYFKIRAFNPAGNGSYTASISQTTRATYEPSKFEQLIQKSNPDLTFLVEVNPLMELSGWTLTDAQTYTYEIPFSERGAELDAVYENGTALVEKSSIATVEALAGTWWHDPVNEMLYVHASDNGTPGSFTVTGSFWLYFANKDGMAFNGHDYLPLVAADGIPDIGQEMQKCYGDNLVVTSGTISFINAWLDGEHYFDRRSARYIWLNRKAKILAGGDDFTYDEFEAINTGIINSHSITDQRFNLNLRDLRDGLHVELPPGKYSLAEFPGMDENAEGKPRPFGFGTITNAVPVCIDTTNKIYEFHAGRCSSVTQVLRNGTALVEDTDYYVDLARGRFILARDISVSTSDVLLVDFVGAVDDNLDAITKGSVMFKYMLNEWLNITDNDLDLDSIYATKEAESVNLSFYFWKEIGSQEAIRRIEQSIMGVSSQDADGKIGLNLLQTSAPSNVVYIPNEMVIDLQGNVMQDGLFAKINLFYNEDPSVEKFSLLEVPANSIKWKYGTSKALDIYVAIASSSDASSLGDDILDELNKQPFVINVPRAMFKHFPGDLFYLSRTRFPSSAGAASSLLCRILRIDKGCTSGRSTIKAEVV